MLWAVSMSVFLLAALWEIAAFRAVVRHFSDSLFDLFDDESGPLLLGFVLLVGALVAPLRLVARHIADVIPYPTRND